MDTIELKSTSLCTLTDPQQPTYVIYSGGIAGINSAPSLKRGAESLDRSADEVQLNRY